MLWSSIRSTEIYAHIINTLVKGSHCVSNGINKWESAELPVIFVTPNHDQVRVCTNIETQYPFHTPNNSPEKYFLFHGYTAQSLTKMIVADLKVPAKAKKWDKDRRYKTLKRSQIMTWGKFIRSLPCVLKSTPDHVIRDLVDDIRNILKPVEFALITEKKDWQKAYEDVSGSCMGLDAKHRQNWGYLSKKDAPVDFYSYAKGIKLATLRKGNMYKARAVVTEIGDTVNIIRVYPAESHASNEIVKGVRAAYPNKTITGPGARFKWEGHVSVPGVLFDGKLNNSKRELYACPMPYFDYCDVAVCGKYDPTTHVFDLYVTNSYDVNAFVKTNKMYKRAPDNNARGCYTSREFEILECVQCKKMFQYSDYTITHSRTGETTCGQTCSTQHGWVKAFRSDGETYWETAEDCVQDIFNTWYVNESVNESLAGHPVREDIATAPEDELRGLYPTYTIEIPTKQLVGVTNEIYNMLFGPYRKNGLIELCQKNFFDKKRIEIIKAKTVEFEEEFAPIEETNDLDVTAVRALFDAGEKPPDEASNPTTPGA